MRLRLPDELGSAEFETNRRTSYAGRVTVTVEGVGEVSFPENVLTDVPPPLPEEPPAGTTVLIRGDGEMRGDCVWHRHAGGWYGTTWPNQISWRALCDMDPAPVPMVPALEPVNLPWWGPNTNGIQEMVGVEGAVADEIAVKVDGEPAYVSRPVARTMARALLTAAGDLP
jgi:hypothetical protein